MHTQLRFLKADQRWGLRVKQDGEQTQKFQSAVGHPHGGEQIDKTVLTQESLSEPGSNTYLHIVKAVAKPFEIASDSLVHALEVQFVQHKGKVVRTVAQEVFWNAGTY